MHTLARTEHYPIAIRLHIRKGLHSEWLDVDNTLGSVTETEIEIVKGGEMWGQLTERARKKLRGEKQRR